MAVMPYVFTDRAPGLLKYFLVLVALITMATVALQVTLSVAVMNADDIKKQTRALSYIQPRSELPTFSFQNAAHQVDANHAGNVDDQRMIRTAENQKQIEETDTQQQVPKTYSQKQILEADNENQDPEINNQQQILEADNQKQVSEMDNNVQTVPKTDEQDHAGEKHVSETDYQQLQEAKNEKQVSETDNQQISEAVIQKQVSETNIYEQTAPKTDENDHDRQKQASETVNNQQIPEADSQNQLSETDKHLQIAPKTGKQDHDGQNKRASETEKHKQIAPKTDEQDHAVQESETDNQQLSEDDNQKQASEMNDHEPIAQKTDEKDHDRQEQDSDTDKHEQAALKTDEQGRSGSNEENQPATAKMNDNIETRNKTKYLIYLCDKKTYCYGFGDRMRAVASVYYLAEITNRRFGLIMTSPTDIREFYEPNQINWDIPASELPVNATTKELVVYGSKNILNLDIIDFNVEHPEDIVYIRTNQELWHTILKNPVYRGKIPKWALVYKSEIMPRAWLRLMRPTAVLRRSLNYALMDIAQEIQEEEDIRKRLDGSNCCQKRTPGNITVCDGVNVTHNGSNMTAQESCYEYNVAGFKCYTFGKKCPFVDSSKCFEKLKLSFGGSKNASDSDIAESAQNYCTNTLSSSTYEGSVDSLGQLTGFNVTNMNLICAHIRLGDWMTFRVKGKRVKLNHHKYLRVWNFFQGFAKKGHHIFVASDSPEWKEIGRSFFGKRMHTLKQSSKHGAMAHIAFDRGGDKARDGMLFALTEQLLLATSCQELLISESGFSLRPSQLRPHLMRANKVWKLKTKSTFQIYQ